jgi:NADH:ubiquinone oxidoreductase subunit 5 (subunit L)/multisubunit Na+/H+ antiporter MnhA subunit
MFITYVGAATAPSVRRDRRLVQNDIKRVIAYSTCSQLGYMFLAAGVGAYRRRCSTCSPTPSSRRCCSWARAR